MPAMTWKGYVLNRHLAAFGLCRGNIDHEIVAVALEHHTVFAFRRLLRHRALAHVCCYPLRLARQRVAMAAAAGCIEPEHVPLLERIVGIAGRQPLGLLALGIDHDRARPAGRAAGAAVRRGEVLHRADREARVLEIEIFAPDAEPAAKAAGAAGILNQLEALDSRRKLALDDLHRRDHG